MSTGSLGAIGSVATGQLQQAREADTDRASQDATRQGRAAEASQRAENAAGIGAMEQEGATSERDADGRRMWEKQQGQPRPSQNVETPAEQELARSRDPLGESGTQLDLSG